MAYYAPTPYGARDEDPYSEQNQARGGDPVATVQPVGPKVENAPAPYLPNDPKRPSPGTGSDTGGPSLPTSEVPLTFGQMQQAGLARPPAPSEPDPVLHYAPDANPAGMSGWEAPTGSQPAPMVGHSTPSIPGIPDGWQFDTFTTANGTQGSPSNYAGAQIRSADGTQVQTLGADQAKALADYYQQQNTTAEQDSLAKSAAAKAAMDEAQRKYNLEHYGSEVAPQSSVSQLVQDSNAAGSDPAARAAWATKYGATGQPQPTGPANYLINGLNVDANGKPVAGGYNALSDLIRQAQAAGGTPGVVTGGMQDLLAKNPALASALPKGYADQYGATLASLGYPTGGSAPVTLPNPGTAPFLPTGGGIPSGVPGGLPTAAPTGGVPTGTGATGGAPGAGGNASDILAMLLGGANGQGAGSAVQNATQQKTLDLLNNPSPYNQQAVQDEYNTLGGQIDDAYALQQKSLDEEMARRGLGVSTNKAGRLNDLNIGKRSAKEQLASDLANKFATTSGQYQTNAINTGNTVGTQAQNNSQSWLSQLMGYGQNAFNNDLATNALNQNATNSYQNFILSLLGLGFGGA